MTAPGSFCGEGSIEGEKCISEGAKIKKYAKRKWLILTISFASDWGQVGGGQSLQLEENAPCPPWYRHWLYNTQNRCDVKQEYDRILIAISWSKSVETPLFWISNLSDATLKKNMIGPDIAMLIEICRTPLFLDIGAMLIEIRRNPLIFGYWICQTVSRCNVK